jgi:hypothetical protein
MASVFVRITLKKRTRMMTVQRRRVMSKWTVWVGGSEVNWQHYTHKIDAERVAEFWREVKGYDDVVVEEVA